MAVVTRDVAPTLEDARRAAQALVDAGVGEVWLYGAVAVLSGVKAKTLWEHDVKAIVGALDDEDTDAFRDLLAVAPELVKSPDYVTMWRTRGAYGTPTEGMTAQEVASPSFARAIGLIACDVAAYAAGAVRRRIGEHQDVADVRRWASRVGAGLREHDLSTGTIAVAASQDLAPDAAVVVFGAAVQAQAAAEGFIEVPPTAGSS